MGSQDIFKTQKQIEEQAAAIYLNNLSKAIEKDLANGKEVFEEEQQIGKMLVTESGNLLPQHRLALLFLDEDFRSLLYGNTGGALSQAFEIEQIKSLVSSDKPNLGPRIPLQATIEKFESFLDRVEDISPFQDREKGRDFFDRLTLMPLPLEEEDRHILGDVFSSPETVEDVEVALFLGVAATTPPNIWQAKKNLPKIQLDLYNYVDYINLIASNYLNPLIGDLFRKRFGQADAETISPNQEYLLSVILAGNFARSTIMLPQHFTDYIREDVFPGLSEETKMILVGFYIKKFEPIMAELAQRPDDLGFSPYQHAWDASQNETGTAYFRSLVDTYTPENATDRANIDWFAENFSRLTKSIGNLITTVGSDTNIEAIDISSYRNSTIDLIVINEDEVAYAIQLDDRGSIVGLPKDLQEKGTAYINYLLGKVRDHYEPTWQRERRKPTLASPDNGQVADGILAMPAQEPPQLTSISREERKTRYEELKGKEEQKRKALRAAGLLPPLPAEKEQTSSTSTAPRRETTRQFHIGLSRTEMFSQQLAALPTQMQELVEGILEKISSNPDYVRKHLKPLKEKDPRYQDLNAYSARAGIDYRIKFVQTGSGQMAIASIEPRGKAYDDLTRDYKAAEQSSN